MYTYMYCIVLGQPMGAEGTSESTGGLHLRVKPRERAFLLNVNNKKYETLKVVYSNIKTEQILHFNLFSAIC